MSEKYRTQSTSSQSLKVEDRVLSETSNSRKILRPLIVENPNDSDAGVKISILYQKAVTKNTFEDISAVPLNTLKASEIGKLNLDTAETKKLYTELQNLFAIHKEKGVPRGEREIVVGFNDEIIKTDPQRAELIKRLVEKGHSKEVWQQLVESDPDLATKLSLARMQQYRQFALNEFEAALEVEDKSESYWQTFFQRNTWIFGYGLNYQILKSVANQPVYGGQSVNGDGANKGDFLKATQGIVNFTVLVEIKKSSTPLLDAKPYRNDTYSPHSEVIGGISQLRSNAHRWEIEGAQLRKNSDLLEGNNIFTVRPKMLLLVGHCKQLTDRARRESFQLLRTGQLDVEILTFDEVYARAKFIVEHNDLNISDSKDGL